MGRFAERARSGPLIWTGDSGADIYPYTAAIEVAMIEIPRSLHGVMICICLASPACFHPVGMESTGGSSSSGGAASTGGPASSDGEATANEVTSGSEVSDSEVVTASASATSEPGSSGEPTTGDSTGSVTGSQGPMCGNGVRELGEDCDQGPDNGVDQPCTPECRLATCGDGHICTECSPAEECDDANPIAGDGCEPGACTVGKCGNRIVEKYEECDPPDGVNCSERCTGMLRRVFLTSQRYVGAIGGVGPGDAICRKLGRDHFTPKREFVAWLSGGEPAGQRIGNSEWPYLLPTGLTVAANTQALLGAPLGTPINVTELGLLIEPDTLGCGGAGVWTGTTAQGSNTGLDCGGWTGSEVVASVGDFTRSDAAWSHLEDCLNCDSTALHFYCIEKATP